MSKDNKTSFKKSFIIGNGEKKSDRNATLPQSVVGVKQGGFFSFDEDKIQVSDVHGIAVESAEPVFKERSYELQDGLMSGIFFENTEILLKGQGVHGLHFRGAPSQYEYQEG
ncbi:hypothetical protein [Bartonella grahamii]|uniref:Uncharacterized protein n=1 Tax=Bartonella grahamii TaxID=33045 RepID=A0A336NAZ5_BARGR|nr:hypothetical protein [Bartonella grahamii]SSZ39265.1 Uncharacterised protein [Bartonella grahamii]